MKKSLNPAGGQAIITRATLIALRVWRYTV